jgi:spore coat polysaccharide biosynthesis protein SpsF
MISNPQVFISVRFSSSRLPGKCMLLVNDVPIILHLINRLRSAQLIPIVCTSVDKSDDVIADFCEIHEVDYFRGALSNKIERWADCSDSITAEYIHIIGADNPFIDADEIKESLFQAQISNLDFVNTSQRSDSGFGSVGISVSKSFLQVLKQRTYALQSNDLDVIPWELLIEDGDSVAVQKDNFLLDDKDYRLRLTLDYEEDFLLLSHLIDELGPTAPRRSIERYLFDHPHRANVNLFRNQDFLKNQKEKLKSNFNLIK